MTILGECYGERGMSCRSSEVGTTLACIFCKLLGWMALKVLQMILPYFFRRWPIRITFVINFLSASSNKIILIIYKNKMKKHL